MRSSERTKSCSKCEADVSIHATYCPFCGTDLLSPSSFQKVEPKETIRESLAALYNPPYSTRSKQGVGIPDEREQEVREEEKPLFSNSRAPASHPTENHPSAENRRENSLEENVRGSVWSLFFLSIGAYLLIFGTLIFLFSQEGVLTLRWQARYWVFYWLLGIPFVVFGARKLRSL